MKAGTAGGATTAGMGRDDGGDGREDGGDGAAAEAWERTRGRRGWAGGARKLGVYRLRPRRHDLWRRGRRPDLWRRAPCHPPVMSHVDLASDSDLDAMIHGVETCNLDAVKHGVDPLGPKMRFYQPRVQKRTFFKKKVKL